MEPQQPGFQGSPGSPHWEVPTVPQWAGPVAEPLVLQTRALVQSQKQVLFKALDYKTFSLFLEKGQWEAGSWGSRGSGPQPHITVTTSFAINHGPQENTLQDSTQHARSSQPKGRVR